MFLHVSLKERLNKVTVGLQTVFVSAILHIIGHISSGWDTKILCAVIYCLEAFHL